MMNENKRKHELSGSRRMFAAGGAPVGVLCLCVLAAVLAAPLRGEACSVPVFRYALERWPADLFYLIVYHRGELSEADKKTVKWLEEAADSDTSIANYQVMKVNLDLAEASSQPAASSRPAPASQPAATSGPATASRPAATSGPATAEQTEKPEKPPKVLLDLWKTQKAAKLPWVVAIFPRTYRRPEIRVAWVGPLNVQSAKNIVDSPARRQVARRIIAGETAVWVLLESGKKKADDKAYNELKKHLDMLQKTLRLPAQPPPYPGQEDLSKKLRIAFSIVRVSRKDPAERAFVQMLMRTEDDLEKEYASATITFPIFGQGRALFALVDEGITEDNVAEACEFLTGACSCQVKQLNPGTDMLMAVDWQAALGDDTITEVELPPLPTPVAVAVASRPAAPTTQSAESRPAGVAGSGSPPPGLEAKAGRAAAPLPPAAVGGINPILRNVLLMLGGVVILAVAATLWARKQGNRA